MKMKPIKMSAMAVNTLGILISRSRAIAKDWLSVPEGLLWPGPTAGALPSDCRSVLPGFTSGVDVPESGSFAVLVGSDSEAVTKCLNPGNWRSARNLVGETWRTEITSAGPSNPGGQIQTGPILVDIGREARWRPWTG